MAKEVAVICDHRIIYTLYTNYEGYDHEVGGCGQSTLTPGIDVRQLSKNQDVDSSV